MCTTLGRVVAWRTEEHAGPYIVKDECRGRSSPSSQLAFFCNTLVLLVQIPDAIFELTVCAFWKTGSYHEGTMGRRICAGLNWPVRHHLADSEFMG